MLPAYLLLLAVKAGRHAQRKESPMAVEFCRKVLEECAQALSEKTQESVPCAFYSTHAGLSRKMISIFSGAIGAI